ncbi:Phenylalanine--tRNA ligase beta subunit [bioreactor metagenome]|uniref:Phenylalanine--tRNA ligase beta subunit n=1 Tax=bioreactor metagenome TaxID=1076179 RepID=A0A645GJG2_9ZZZZ
MPERFSDALKLTYDIYDLKGALESLFELMHVTRYRFVPVEDGRYRKGCAAEIQVEGKTVGTFGELAGTLTKGWRTTHPVFAAQLEVAPLLAADRGAGYYTPFSLFPATSRDVAFLAPAGLTHAEVLEFFRKAKPADLESVRLFDIFEKDGRKSMAYQLTFRNAERTLTDAEVNTRFEKLREKLKSDLKVELR